MFSQALVRGCLQLLYAQTERPLDMSIYRDILTVFEQIKKYYHDHEVPLRFKNEVKIINSTCEYMLDGGEIEDMMTTIAVNERYKQCMDMLQTFQEEYLEASEVKEWQIRLQTLLAFNKMNETYKQFEKYRDVINQGDYNTIEDAIEQWSDLVKTASAAVSEYELNTRSGLVSSFNTGSDEVTPLLNEIRKKYSKSNVITSGIPELDSEFLNGGFQPSRLHLFAGTSGSGKSVLLMNMARRAAMAEPEGILKFYPGNDPFDDSPERVFLYVTMENYVYETWLRLYCSLFHKTKEESLRELFSRDMTEEYLKKQINDLMAPYKSSIQIEYFPSHTKSPATISSLIGKLNERPNERVVKAAYIDYLDLMVSTKQKEHYRLELGEITSQLKSIAANYEIPIVTATQLNREAYKKGKSTEVGSEMISESIQKLFIVDFSAMMYWDNPDDQTGAQDTYMPQKVVLKVDKNRDGKTGRTHIYMNYQQSRFLTQQEYAEEYQKLLEI